MMANRGEFGEHLVNLPVFGANRFPPPPFPSSAVHFLETEFLSVLRADQKVRGAFNKRNETLNCNNT